VQSGEALCLVEYDFSRLEWHRVELFMAERKDLRISPHTLTIRREEDSEKSIEAFLHTVSPRWFIHIADFVRAKSEAIFSILHMT
jgi:hypothetical protein